MGSSESSEEKPSNIGAFNGNEISANAQVINHINIELERLEVLQTIAVTLKSLILLLILVKMLIKYVKKSQRRNDRIEQIALRHP